MYNRGMTNNRYLTATEAAAELGISLPTLYAYVSRGLIRSEAAGGSRRDRRYRRDDVDRLRARQEQRRNPDRAAEQALSWGVPVLESALTLIADGRFYYRGLDAVELARTGTFEQVAELLWTGSVAGPAGVMTAGQAALRAYYPWLKLLPDAAPVENIQAVLPIAATRDAAAYDLRPAAVAQTGARVLGLLTAAAVYPAAPAAERIAECLQQGWMSKSAGRLRPDGAARLIDAALILSADHELNTSAFTARCVASVRGTPYQVVIAGLAALRGLRHGGHMARVEALFDETRTAKSARAMIGAWLRRGERLPGFGHPLYPEGDPRARALLAWTRTAQPRSPELALAQAIAQEARALIGEHPTIDFALVVAARALKLPRGAALAMFALGRAAGWIAQAIEQYQSEAMIRPRARYVGVMPE
jgi:citrate synthase